MSQVLQQIDSALDKGDTLAAAKLAEGALASGQSDGILYNLVAWLREEEGSFAEAETMLRTALACTPDDATLHLPDNRKRSKKRRQVALPSLVCLPESD